jgi:scyllo-inositol 2-dehydrogenase (NADP+)
MIRLAVIGLGKMGISHLATVNSHPDVQLIAVCDANAYVSKTLSKYTGIKVFTKYQQLLSEGNLDAVIIATPPRSHGEIVRVALDRHLHVFCEKPFCLNAHEGAELAALAQARGLVNQVGYHFRFVETFKEAKRFITAGTLGRMHHVRVEAFGPVVLRPKGATWRARRTEGGGCLHDYATHAINLVTYLVGTPNRVSGTVLNRIFSQDVEDEVYTTLHFADGMTGQLCVNWSDESYRKLSTKVTIWGTNGRLSTDRQELQLFLRKNIAGDPKLRNGWNVFYTTDLPTEVWYYLRGEEYSAQIEHFIQSIKANQTETISSFASAVETDQIVSMMKEDSDITKNNGAQYRSRQKMIVPRINGILRRVQALRSLRHDTSHYDNGKNLTRG